MSALVAPSCECLPGEGLVWLIGAVVCSLAAAAGPIIVRVARSMDGRISAAAVLAHCRSTATSDDCKAQLVRFRPCKTDVFLHSVYKTADTTCSFFSFNRNFVYCLHGEHT